MGSWALGPTQRPAIYKLFHQGRRQPSEHSWSEVTGPTVSSANKGWGGGGIPDTAPKVCAPIFRACGEAEPPSLTALHCEAELTSRQAGHHWSPRKRKRRLEP